MTQFDLTDEQREIQELARRFTADRLTPVVHARGLAAALPRCAGPARRS